MSHITLRVETQYGHERRYATDVRVAEALQQLTGTRTLTQSHINALIFLGHSFSEVEVMGRKIAQ